LRPDSWNRAHQRGLDLKALLQDNNAYGFFQALGDLLITGETAHNLNDFRVLVVESKG